MEQVSKVIEAMRHSGAACVAACLLAGFFGWLTFQAYQRDADRRAHTQDILLERCYPETTHG